MTIIQFILHKTRGYGTDDSLYKDWFLRLLAKRAPQKNWVGLWSNGTPRPWVGGKDKRLVSDAEFREIIKQNMPIMAVPTVLEILKLNFDDFHAEKSIDGLVPGIHIKTLIPVLDKLKEQIEQSVHHHSGPCNITYGKLESE